MSSINITRVASEQLEPAARLLARAFVTNPLHVAAFGAGRLAANEAFFRTGLAAMKGPKLVAMEGSQLIGVIHWVLSPACQYSLGEKLRMMPRIAWNVGVRPAFRLGRGSPNGRSSTRQARTCILVPSALTLGCKDARSAGG